MSAISRFVLTETSEKTAEVNALSDMSNLIEKITGRKVTILSPTPREERRLAVDDIFASLPQGRIIALQFKRPFQLRKPPNAIRFALDVQQLQRLLNNFNKGEAFYALVPFPLTSELVRKRVRLLELSYAIDVFDILKGRKTSQDTRTIRYNKGQLPPGGRRFEISDPWAFEELTQITTLKSLCTNLIEGKIGYLKEEQKKRIIEKGKLGVRHLYYLNLSSEKISEAEEESYEDT